MEKRKIQSGRRYILAFLIGTFIFVNGFVFTYAFSYLEYQRISNAQEGISYDIFKDKLESSFFNKDVCSGGLFEEISENLRFQGVIIDELERKLGKNNKKVLFRKKFYTLIELEHFEFVKEIKEECDFNISVLLFFYSNVDKDLDESEDAGKLLDAVYNRNENVIIYSFDVNLDDDLIRQLKEKYGISEFPVVVVNEVNNVVKPVNVDDIESHL